MRTSISIRYRHLTLNTLSKVLVCVSVSGLVHQRRRATMAVYVVTGGAGFIGSNIVEELLTQGAKVRIIDNFATGRKENLDPFKNKVDFREVDICDLGSLKTAVRGADFVLHQAA